MPVPAELTTKIVFESKNQKELLKKKAAKLGYKRFSHFSRNAMEDYNTKND